MKRKIWVLFSLFLLGLMPACTGPAQTAAPVISVFAAASLGDAFRALGGAYQARSGVAVALSLAGSQKLAYQIREGAPADVFAAASADQMETAVQSGRIAPGAAREFAANRLVVVVSLAAEGQVASLADLAKNGVRLVFAADEVPAGHYTLRFLSNASRDPAFGADYANAVLRNVVSYEENVKAVVNKVALGEADAGIVYVTDLYGQPDGRVQAIPIPDALNVLARYPIAALADSPNAAAAQAFVDFVLSSEGQAILAEYDFLPAQ